jgi:hypothetical protein
LSIIAVLSENLFKMCPFCAAGRRGQTTLHPFF